MACVEVRPAIAVHVSKRTAPGILVFYMFLATIVFVSIRGRCWHHLWWWLPVAATLACLGGLGYELKVASKR